MADDELQAPGESAPAESGADSPAADSPELDPAPGESEAGSLPADSPLDEMALDVLAELGTISMGSAATALSSLLQKKVEITSPIVSVVPEKEVPNRAAFPHVRVEVSFHKGLEGINYLIVAAPDAAVIADLMMGGDGSNADPNLSDLQISAVTEAMNQMMGSSATAMSSFFDARVEISPADAVFVTDAEEPTGEELVVYIRFSIRIGELVDSELVQVMSTDFAWDVVHRAAVISVEAGERSEQHVAAAAAAMEEEAADAGPAEEPAAAAPQQPAAQEEARAPRRETAAAWQQESDLGIGNLHIELIKDIPVEVSAFLGESELSMEEVLRLGPGSVVELDQHEGEDIEIHANGVPIARGEVVVINDQFGVRITEVVPPSARMRSLRPH